MANSLQTMITRIGTEIRRPSLGSAGLTSPIALAIFDAIAIYQKDRFRINDDDPSAPVTFNTVANRAIYGVGDNANIGTVFVIDFLTVQIGATLTELDRRTMEDIVLLNQIGQQAGPPSDYAYGANQIVIYPVPSQVWPITIGGHISYPAPVTLVDTANAWMNWGERLIRCRAKYEIATHITRNQQMATAMSPDADGGPNGKPGEAWRAWRELKNGSNKIKSVGRVRSMAW